MENKKNNTSTIAGLVLVGCMFIGIGLGILYNMIVVGLFIGMGAGFVGMGIAYGLFRQK